MGSKVTDGLVERMRDMRGRGLSTVRIGQILGVSTSTVSAYTRQVSMRRGESELSDRIEYLEWCLRELTKVPDEIAVALDLTRKPARILGAMMGKPGKPLSREQLCLAAGYDNPRETTTPESIDVQICYLRKTLAAHAVKFGSIETCWGVGYKWVPAQ